MTVLARRGPHRVLRGDLGFVGVRGQIFTPEKGTGLPLVAFAHAWMADSGRYRDLLFHLASHGIVTREDLAEQAVEPGFNDFVGDFFIAPIAEMKMAKATILPPQWLAACP